VQDLLNTRDIGGKVPDLLATVEQARDWLRTALPVSENHWEPWISALTERDVVAIGAMRRELQTIVAGEGAAPAVPPVSTTLVVAPGGEVHLEPTGNGRQRFRSAVWCGIFLAQQADVWKRLKLCRNPPCGSAFYDRSKNNSGAWHDVKTCGNAVNLRASRARKRLV